MINPRKVTLTSATDKKQYDGKPLTNKEITVGGDGFVEGEGADYTVTGSQTAVGSSKNTFSYSLTAGTKEGNYEITQAEGTLTVTNRDTKYEVTVVAKSTTATYDGKEHEAKGVETYEFTIDGVKYTVSGLTTEDPSQKDAGRWTNNITGTPVVTDESGNTVTDQFTVNTENGNLVITPRKVTLTSATLEKTYDGTALVNADAPSLGVTINENKLLVEEGWVDGEGATYTFDGTQTLVGSSNNKFSYELKKNTKAENYTITKTEGTLTVTDDDVEPGKVITKTHEGSEFALGDTITFTIKVKNIYDEVKTITITEQEGVTITGESVFENVEPGEEVKTTAKYVVREQDILEQKFHNTATASFSGGKSFNGEDDATVEEAKPAFTATKVITEEQQNATFGVDDTVLFKIIVENTGNVTLNNVTVGEDLKDATIKIEAGYTVDNNVATIKTLAPKAIVTVYAKYTVQQKDVDNADLVNTATVNAKDPDGKDLDTKKPSVEVPTEDPAPAVAITKTTTSTSADAVGYAEDETITYDIQATNTGNVTLHDVVITDEKTGDTWNVGTLAPNASTDVYKASYKVTQADILVGEVENKAVVVGTPARAEKEAEVAAQAFEEVVHDNTVTDSASVTDPTVKPSSALKVTKTVTSKGSTITIDGKDVNGYRVGDTIEFNIHVENTGNITLNNIVVNDVPTLDAGSPKGSITIAASADGKYTVDGSTATIATLAPKASVDIKASYLVMAGDGTVKGNKLFNTAFATGTSEDPNNPQPGDSSKTDPVPIEPEPDDGNGAMEGSITVTKMITTSDGKTPTSGVNAAIKVGLYDNASFSGTPIAVNTITISNATSGNTVFNELDNTANTTYYVAELDANNQPIVAANAHLEGYGAPAYSDNCKNGINPTTATDTAATIINPLEALSVPEGGLEETEDTTEKTTEKSSTTSDSSTSTKSSTAAKTGDDTNMMIYWLLLGMAVLAGCTAVVYRKRKER
ncbi:conserved repeat domain [uncultured Clostridium sp.]|nr:conserved repeat domain [uncultured Clostridium sp.]